MFDSDLVREKVAQAVQILKEDVVVTPRGVEWLTKPQTELLLIKS